MRLVGAACALVASLLAIYARDLLSGGHVLTGDLVDGRLADVLQMHWFNVLAGRERWNDPPFYHPAPDTLGLNDGFLLFGLASAAFRVCGADPFLSSELAGAVFRVAGFAGLYTVARLGLRLPHSFAVLAAAVGILSNNIHLQGLHEQLLAVFLAPALAALLIGADRALRAGASRRAGLIAAGAALLVGAWALTAFYALLFTALLGALLAAAAATLRPRRVPAALRRATAPPFRLPYFLLALFLVPTLLTYLPALATVRPHAWWETASFLLRPLDLVSLGDGNFVGNAIYRALGVPARPWSEHVAGLTPLLWVLAVGGGLHAARRAGAAPLLLPLAIAGAALLALSFRYGHVAPWRVVQWVMPGSAAVRVVCRDLLLLSLVAVLLAADALATLRARGVPAVVIAGLAALLLAEEIDTGGEVALDRREENRFLARLGTPPAGCPFFVLARERPPPAGSNLPPSFVPLLARVDAALIAEWTGIPTPIGLASFLPPGASDDLPAAIDVARGNGGAPVCEVDPVTGRWNRLAAPVPLMTTGTVVGFGQGAAVQPVIGAGWSVREADGRWTVGRGAVFVLRAPPGRALALVLRASVGFAAGRHPSGVTIFANGHAIASWPNDPVPRDHTLLVPADLIGADGRVRITLAASDRLSPRALGLSADPRPLGVFVMSVAAR